ncbi:M56 family metallopeptidase [Emticicia sp. BO119]|uniref:M56 family metallopeptidase n=1 Tax=Emticicia sp. BO119 TaxID=2757768 RepID=UPI0015F0262E|nr:M56 family metallopeptidase [Emticicia sp. BO119]MBA4848855.1 M56 family metallopeptidase [Emticicia sp. BO119]
MSVLIYLLKVNLILIAFYAFYWVFLRKNTFFQTNRLYLLLSVVVSFLMPFIKIRHNYTFSQPLPVTLNEVSTESIKSVIYQPVLEDNYNYVFNWMDIVSAIYLAGVIVFSLRFIIALVKIYFLLRDSEPIDMSETRSGREYWLLRTNKAFSSYSFFNFLILNKEDIFYNRNIITDHEEVHISQGHSWDIFFIEIAHIFCWFNPLLISYKTALTRLHEFIADSIVEGDEKVPYAQFLFAYNFRMNASPLGNDFFKDSLLKERIKMMMKNRTPLWVISKYIFILPLVVCMGYFVVAQDVRRVKPVDLLPAEFKGGIRAFETYFAKNFKYPEGKILAGDIYASFMVNKYGELTELTIDKGLRADYNGRVAEVLGSMPYWTPAERRKKPVESRVFLRITVGKPYGIIANQSDIDPAFKGVLVVDGKIINTDQKLYREDYYRILENTKTLKDKITATLRLTGENQKLIDTYGKQARFGVDLWMTDKLMLVIHNDEEKLIENSASSFNVDDTTVDILSPIEATKKYGEKAKNGAIIITDNY